MSRVQAPDHAPLLPITRIRTRTHQRTNRTAQATATAQASILQQGTRIPMRSLPRRQSDQPRIPLCVLNAVADSQLTFADVCKLAICAFNERQRAAAFAEFALPIVSTAKRVPFRRTCMGRSDPSATRRTSASTRSSATAACSA